LFRRVASFGLIRGCMMSPFRDEPSVQKYHRSCTNILKLLRIKKKQSEEVTRIDTFLKSHLKQISLS
jgi:hypothetical protein